MNKKQKILTAALALSLAGIGVAYASSNSITQIDVRKSSNDTVNLTLYSSNPSGSNVMVRKKSDNKYVILIPNSSANITTPDFHAAKDLINNVNVKSVSDTSDGYTKVTVITKKPVNIKAKTVKSKPVTAEQIAYRSLLKDANTTKANSIKTTASRPIMNSKTKMIAPPTSATKAKKPVVSKSTTKVAAKTPVTKPITAQTKPVQKQTKIAMVPAITKVIKEQPKQVTKTQPITTNKVETKTPVTKPVTAQTKPVQNTKVVQTIPPVTEQPKNIKRTPIFATLGHSIKNVVSDVAKIPERIPMSAFYGLAAFALLLIMGKLFKSNNKEKDIPANFVGKVKTSPVGTVTKKFSDITSDNNLNWRDKYKKFNDAVSDPTKYEQEKFEKIKKVKYAFINNDLTNKRNSLENMINAPQHKFKGVHSEGDAINSSLKDLKLKGFADTPIMKETSRDRLNGRFKKYEHSDRYEEQDNLKLGNSKLHKNLRKFKNAALNVFDVKPKTKSIKELKRIEELKKQDYVMSSLDEFFSVANDEVKRVVKPEVVNSKDEIISNLINVKPTIHMPRKETPVADLSKAFATNPLNSKPVFDNGQLTVDAHYEIDARHGFYIVNMDNKSALIAKANDEVFVLKQFDRIVRKPLQVRRDKDNVYMVKTEGFKSLVEVNDNKVGVLIEL